MVCIYYHVLLVLQFHFLLIYCMLKREEDMIIRDYYEQFLSQIFQVYKLIHHTTVCLDHSEYRILCKAIKSKVLQNH